MTWVYFIKPIGMEGPIKIGCSYSPDRRRSSLELWSPFPLEIVAEWEGGAVVERQFHALFAHAHQHHEWFEPVPELMAVIARIQAGTFHGAELPAPQRLPRKVKNIAYITPGWCYERSVTSRMQHMRRDLRWRDPDYDEWCALASDIHVDAKLDAAGVEALKLTLEPKLVLLREWSDKRRTKARAA